MPFLTILAIATAILAIVGAVRPSIVIGKGAQKIPPVTWLLIVLFAWSAYSTLAYPSSRDPVRGFAYAVTAAGWLIAALRWSSARTRKA